MFDTAPNDTAPNDTAPESTVVFDTTIFDARHRLDALHAAYSDEIPPRTVVADPRVVRHRTERHCRADPTEFFAIGFHRRGRTRVCTGGVDSEVPIGSLNCVDLTRPYELVHHDENRHEVLIVSNREVSISVDTVRAAVPLLTRSPVYPLVRHHVAGLFAAALELPARPRLLTGGARSHCSARCSPAPRSKRTSMTPWSAPWTCG